MRLAFMATAAVLLFAGFCQAAEVELKTTEDRANYAVGFSVGTNMKRDGIPVRSQALARGVEDAAAGKNELMTQEEREMALGELQVLAEKNMREQARLKGEKAVGEGKEFLAANTRKEGVKTTASGLQYKVIKEGKGGAPKATDTVTVQYRGTLLDGTEFDSSFKRGQPATFKLNQVIKGWTEGLQLMKPGGRFVFYIPADLAYGAQGAGEAVPPNSMLIFEVELLSVTPS